MLIRRIVFRLRLSFHRLSLLRRRRKGGIGCKQTTTSRNGKINADRRKFVEIEDALAYIEQQIAHIIDFIAEGTIVKEAAKKKIQKREKQAEKLKTERKTSGPRITAQ